MFRTADACGFSRLFLCGYTATPPKVQIDKVSLGAETWIPWEQHDDVVALIKKLQSDGVRVLALEKNDTSVPIDSVSYEAPLALVVGNEVDGVDAEVLSLCDQTVHIPMHGRKESLNVSVAAGIAMYTIHNRISI